MTKGETISNEATWLDIVQYFAASVVLIANMISVHYLSNIIPTIWLSFVAVPMMDYFSKEYTKNIQGSMRIKNFEKDSRFRIPLYCTIVIDTCFWLYMLNCMSAGSIGQTPFNFISYVVGGALMGSLATISGHELFHKRSTLLKVIGCIPYVKFMSTHIHIFHVNFHHKESGIPGVDDIPLNKTYY